MLAGDPEPLLPRGSRAREGDRLLGGGRDDQTHSETWNGLVKLVKRSDFLYVADRKLATREQMAHIQSHGGRFLSILPRSRAEDSRIRDWAHTHAFDWTEAARRPSKHNRDPRPAVLSGPGTDPQHRKAPYRLDRQLAKARV